MMLHQAALSEKSGSREIENHAGERVFCPQGGSIQ
jgi:hypothetical protein